MVWMWEALLSHSPKTVSPGGPLAHDPRSLQPQVGRHVPKWPESLRADGTMATTASGHPEGMRATLADREGGERGFCRPRRKAGGTPGRGMRGSVPAGAAESGREGQGGSALAGGDGEGRWPCQEQLPSERRPSPGQLRRPPCRPHGQSPRQELAGRPAALGFAVLRLQLVQQVLTLPRLLLQEAPCAPQLLLPARQLLPEPRRLRPGGLQLQAQVLWGEVHCEPPPAFGLTPPGRLYLGPEPLPRAVGLRVSCGDVAVGPLGGPQAGLSGRPQPISPTTPPLWGPDTCLGARGPWPTTCSCRCLSMARTAGGRARWGDPVQGGLLSWPSAPSPSVLLLRASSGLPKSAWATFGVQRRREGGRGRSSGLWPHGDLPDYLTGQLAPLGPTAHLPLYPGTGGGPRALVMLRVQRGGSALSFGSPRPAGLPCAWTPSQGRPPGGHGHACCKAATPQPHAPASARPSWGRGRRPPPPSFAL